MTVGIIQTRTLPNGDGFEASLARDSKPICVAKTAWAAHVEARRILAETHPEMTFLCEPGPDPTFSKPVYEPRAPYFGPYEEDDPPEYYDPWEHIEGGHDESDVRAGLGLPGKNVPKIYR